MLCPMIVTRRRVAPVLGRAISASASISSLDQPGLRQSRT
jgi:hypothetical protein